MIQTRCPRCDRFHEGACKLKWGRRGFLAMLIGAPAALAAKPEILCATYRVATLKELGVPCTAFDYRRLVTVSLEWHRQSGLLPTMLGKPFNLKYPSTI